MSPTVSSYDPEAALADHALRELQAARDRVREPHRDWLLHRGVAEETLYMIDYGVGRIQTARHRFWISRRGDPAVILPICGGRTDCWSPDLFDLAAFRIAEPERSYSLSGAAPWFNPWAIEDACRRLVVPLVAYRSLLGWLRGGGEGAVPLLPTARSELLPSLAVKFIDLPLGKETRHGPRSSQEDRTPGAAAGGGHGRPRTADDGPAARL